MGMHMAEAADPFLRAFEQLRIAHLAFRRAEPEEIRELEAMRLEILKTEAAHGVPRSTIEAAHVATSPYPLQGVVAAHQDPTGGAIVEMKFRLMERAFAILQLNHFANAPENHGWMNLFRQWSASSETKAAYESLKNTLSPSFREFYENYIYACPERMEDNPIHHPWHGREGRPGTGLFMDTGRTEPRTMPARTRAGEGGVTDAKGHGGRDQTYETSSDSDPNASGGAPPNA